MTGVRDTIERAAAAEQRAAIRRLLTQPLVGQREHPDDYASIVKHARDLAGWFADHTGWQLVVDASGGFARLHKTPSHPDATRPATTSTRERRPFDTRRYTLVCLALAALDQRPGQTTLRSLVDAVTARSHELDGVAAYDGTHYGDRRALVDALRLLTELGIIAQRDGDTDRYARSGSGDALYDIDDRRLGQLIAAPSSPSLVEGPDDLPVEVYPDTEEGVRLRARHRVMRRLLDDPVVHYDDLDEAERDWLRYSLGHVHAVLDHDVGLVLERRAEGAIAVDPERELTDETFPDGNSTVKHAALLLAEQLTARVRATRSADRTLPDPAPVVGDDWVVATTQQLLDGIGQRAGWSAAYLDDERGARRLTDDAMALLERFGLVVRRPDARAASETEAGTGSQPGWQPRPAIARFAPAAPTPTGAPARPRRRIEPTPPAAQRDAQTSLFEERP